MELSEFLVNEIVIEHKSVAEVVAANDVSRSWLYELLARYRKHGPAGLKPESRRPDSSPTRISEALEEEIVAIRKSLSEEGLDAGPHTIQYHLQKKHKRAVPSVATIWRVLSRRGFVTPQPHKRPKSSYKRFQADLPNECWQADTTHWLLLDGRDVEILNVEDDCSRLLVASRAFSTTKGVDVVATFHEAAEEWGFPASVLTDNGAIFTAEYRNGRCAMEGEMASLGIEYKHSRPYHPQTCGKVERFHQTLKKWLAKQPRARTIAELQAQLDTFRAHYNAERPHRALERKTPLEVFEALAKAKPRLPAAARQGHYRVRRDKVDAAGKVSLRYRSRLRHLGIGRAHAGEAVILLVADREVRVVNEDGELLAEHTIDPSRIYQPRKESV
jgi:transposase InsO family protein